MAASPKSTELPVVANSTASCSSWKLLPSYPHENIPLVGELVPPPSLLLVPIISPKSVALPVVAVVKKDIVLTMLGLPPSAKTILVELFAAPKFWPVVCASPKSIAFPVVEIVTYSIVLSAVLLALYPAIMTPRVDEELPVGNHLCALKLPKSTPVESDEIVVKSITSDYGSYPPAAHALVELENPAINLLASVILLPESEVPPDEKFIEDISE